LLFFRSGFHIGIAAQNSGAVSHLALFLTNPIIPILNA